MDRNVRTSQSRGDVRVSLAAGAVVALLPLAGAFASLSPAAETASDERAVAEAIEATLQRHGGDVHRCFARSLADSLDAAGTLELEVDVGPQGRVEAARVARQAASIPPALSACVVNAARAWTLASIEPGASVVLPFTLAGQTAQFVVRAADVSDRGPATGKGKPHAGPPFSVKVLADEQNVRATKLSATLLTVGPASRVAMHRHPQSGKLLYLLKGNARILGPSGAAPLLIREGAAVLVPAGYPHVIENMGRQLPAVFLQAFSPPGPERVYRDPTDPQARAAFEVIRDPGKLKVDKSLKPVVATLGDAKATSSAGGKVNTRVLFDAATAGSTGLALSVVEWSPGAAIPRQSNPGSASFFYVLSGGGQLTVGSEAAPFGPEDALYVPPDQPFAIKATGVAEDAAAGQGKGGPEKTVVVRIDAPPLPADAPTDSRKR